MMSTVKNNEINFESTSLVDEILSEFKPSGLPTQQAMLVSCVDTHHPLFPGRICVRLESSDVWLPTLHGMRFQKNDAVMIQQVANCSEPIVVGVVNGIRNSATGTKRAEPELVPADDESIQVKASNGESLLEMYRSDEGTVVQILDPDTHVKLPGRLQVTAEEISLNASKGDVNISAGKEVVVKGKLIRLN